MRQQLNAKVPSRSDKKPGPSIGGLPAPPQKAGLTLGYIIKEKPSRKEVMEYLRERVDQIIEEEEADE